MYCHRLENPSGTQIPGRARFKVAGLQRSEGLKKLLESRLPRRKGIIRACASTITGNVLVFYESDLNVQVVEKKIKDVLRRARVISGNGFNSRPSHPSFRFVSVIRSGTPGRARLKVEGLQNSDALKKLLESRLTRRKKIIRVSASIVTGSLLVHFNSQADARAIAAMVDDLVRRNAANPFAERARPARAVTKKIQHRSNNFDPVRVLRLISPGRARVKIEGLYHSEPLKHLLESRLSLQTEITSAYANTQTGNLLVCYNPEHSTRKVAAIIEKVMEDASENDLASRGAASDTADPPHLNLPEDKKLRPAIRDFVRERLKRVLAQSDEQTVEPCHLLEADTILEQFDTRVRTGLTTKVAQARLRKYGPNSLPESRPRSKWSIFFDQFKSLPTALLGIAAGLSVATGGILEAAVIGGVVIANAFIGFFTESDAENTIRSLKTFVQPHAEIFRDGRIQVVSAKELVPGDIVILKPGAYVPADCRVVESHHLSIDESILTGESMPVYKIVNALYDPNIPIGDRFNMAYMGTLVTGGQGLAVVVGTGRFTEMGRLQSLLEETESPKTPIERQLARMGDQLVVLSGAVCGIIFLIGFLRGHGFLVMSRMAISLAAAAVPEGLPTAATINFARGIKNMKKHRVLVRDLHAVETIGAVQTVCLDKTGTITWNQMAALNVYTGGRRVEIRNGSFVSGGLPINPLKNAELRRLLEVCALCNETDVKRENDTGEYFLNGSPTENALVNMALRAGIDVLRLRVINALENIQHRTENRLFMCTKHVISENTRLLTCKGSPTEVLDMCEWQLRDGEEMPLTDDDRRGIEMENERMAGDALRVLGVAFSRLENGRKSAEDGFIWLGLVGLADPIRGEVKDLIKVFHDANIDTVMITGDQSPTAYAVARELGLSRGATLEILDSSELTAVGPDVLEALANRVHVYARVSPSHKLKIVQALQASGKIVAMTGDGINDGPALKAADIGIAMGESGTDVARGVADVVLEEDNLEALIIAVRDGRTTHNNIRKSVHFFLSTNLSEIMVMSAAMTAGIGFPLNAMQLLWINIISDIFPGLALSMENAEPDVLAQRPRAANEPFFDSSAYKRMAFESAVISSASMGSYAYGLMRYGMNARAGTLAFQSLTVGQLLHALSCRSDKHGIFTRNRLPPNRYLNMAIGGSLAMQGLTMVVPGLRRLLGITPLNLIDGAVIAGSALLSLFVNEATKKRSEAEND